MHPDGKSRSRFPQVMVAVRRVVVPSIHTFPDSLRKTTELSDTDEMGHSSTNHAAWFQGGLSHVGRILVTIACWTLAVGFVFLGGWLIVCGFGGILAAWFVGHLDVSAIIIGLGFACQLAAMALIAVPILMSSRRHSRDMMRQWKSLQDQWPSK